MIFHHILVFAHQASLYTPRARWSRWACCCPLALALILHHVLAHTLRFAVTFWCLLTKNRFAHLLARRLRGCRSLGCRSPGGHGAWVIWDRRSWSLWRIRSC